MAPQVELPDGTVNSRKAFKVTEREFERFGELHGVRAERQLARELSGEFQLEFSTDSYRLAANMACTQGKSFYFTSQKQVRTLAQSYLLFGTDFPKGYPDIEQLMSSNELLNWQKRQALEEWIPKGIARRNLRNMPKMA